VAVPRLLELAVLRRVVAALRRLLALVLRRRRLVAAREPCGVSAM
jgi:hypothetical protein